MIGFFLAILLMILPGILFLVLLRKDGDLWEWVGAGSVVGIGGMGLSLFVISPTGLPVNRWTVGLLVFLLLLFLGQAVWKYRKEAVRSSLRRGRFERPAIGDLILGVPSGLWFVCVLGASFLSATFWPVYRWDAICRYYFRAILFLRYESFTYGDYNVPMWFYPPMTSFYKWWMMLWGSSEVKYLPPILLLATALGFIHFAKKYSIPLWAPLAAAALLASIPFVWVNSTVAYLNLPASLFGGLGIVYFGHWLLDRRTSSLLLANIFCAFAAWTRIDGMLWLGLLVPSSFLLALLFRKPLSWLVSSATGLGIWIMWPLYMRVGEVAQVEQTADAPLSRDLAYIFAPERRELIWDNFKLLWEEYPDYGLFWWLAAGVVVIGLLRINWFHLILILFSVSGLGGIFLSLMAIQNTMAQWSKAIRPEADSSLGRMVLYLIPPVCFLWMTLWMDRKELKVFGKKKYEKEDEVSEGEEKKKPDSLQPEAVA
jgi:hypothetical protein